MVNKKSSIINTKVEKELNLRQIIEKTINIKEGSCTFQDLLEYLFEKKIVKGSAKKQEEYKDVYIKVYRAVCNMRTDKKIKLNGDKWEFDTRSKFYKAEVAGNLTSQRTPSSLPATLVGSFGHSSSDLESHRSRSASDLFGSEIDNPQPLSEENQKSPRTRSASDLFGSEIDNPQPLNEENQKSHRTRSASDLFGSEIDNPQPLSEENQKSPRIRSASDLFVSSPFNRNRVMNEDDNQEFNDSDQEHLFDLSYFENRFCGNRFDENVESGLSFVEESIISENEDQEIKESNDGEEQPEMAIEFSVVKGPTKTVFNIKISEK